MRRNPYSHYGDSRLEPKEYFGPMLRSSFFAYVVASIISDATPRERDDEQKTHDIRRANDAVAAGIVFG